MATRRLGRAAALVEQWHPERTEGSTGSARRQGSHRDKWGGRRTTEAAAQPEAEKTSNNDTARRWRGQKRSGDRRRPESTSWRTREARELTEKRDRWRRRWPVLRKRGRRWSGEARAKRTEAPHRTRRGEFNGGGGTGEEASTTAKRAEESLRRPAASKTNSGETKTKLGPAAWGFGRGGQGQDFDAGIALL